VTAILHRTGSSILRRGVKAAKFARRYVSGYFCRADGVTEQDAGHAWAEALVPDLGWIAFDPTNGIIGNRNLIRVAVASAPEQVLPLWGTYEGLSGISLGMDVTVSVTEESG